MIVRSKYVICKYLKFFRCFLDILLIPLQDGSKVLLITVQKLLNIHHVIVSRITRQSVCIIVITSTVGTGT